MKRKELPPLKITSVSFDKDKEGNIVSKEKEYEIGEDGVKREVKKENKDN